MVWTLDLGPTKHKKTHTTCRTQFTSIHAHFPRHLPRMFHRWLGLSFFSATLVHGCLAFLPSKSCSTLLLSAFSLRLLLALASPIIFTSLSRCLMLGVLCCSVPTLLAQGQNGCIRARTLGSSSIPNMWALFLRADWICECWMQPHPTHSLVSVIGRGTTPRASGDTGNFFSRCLSLLWWTLHFPPLSLS